MRTQSQRYPQQDPPPDRVPVEGRDILALIVCPLGLLLALVSAVIAMRTEPLWTTLLLAGVVLAGAGLYLGTRKA